MALLGCQRPFLPLMKNVVVISRLSSAVLLPSLIHSPCTLPPTPTPVAYHHRLSSANFHTSTYSSQDTKLSKLKQAVSLTSPPKPPKKTLVKHEVYFEYAYQAGATRESYNEALEKFSKGDRRRRGVVEFIYTAMNYMDKFKLEKDLETYNRILDVFPKGPYIPENVFQKMLMFCPHEQACAIDVLQRMEDKGILPSRDTRRILAEVFGAKSYPVKKWQRMIYWMGKFWNLNPFPLPDTLPEEGLPLAKLGLQRIAQYEAEVVVFQGDAETVPVPLDMKLDNTDFIVSAQSEEQREMLSEHKPTRPVYIEGGYHLWLRDKRMEYFILRADPSPDDIHPLMEYDEEDELNPGGPVFAICSTSTSCENSLRSWLRGLQETNPVLGRVPVLFNLSTVGTELMLAEPQM